MLFIELPEPTWATVTTIGFPFTVWPSALNEATIWSIQSCLALDEGEFAPVDQRAQW
jgi:hypothetical protein